MRTVTVEVPEGHMVKIVKEESMQPTQKVLGGGKYHSSVRKLEDIAYLVITQTVRGVNGSE